MLRLLRHWPSLIGGVIGFALAVSSVEPDPKFFGFVVSTVSILCALTVASNTMLFSISSSSFVRLLRSRRHTVEFRDYLGDSVRLGFIALVSSLVVIFLSKPPHALQAFATGAAASAVAALWRVLNIYVQVFSQHERALANEEERRREAAVRSSEAASISAAARRAAERDVVPNFGSQADVEERAER